MPRVSGGSQADSVTPQSVAQTLPPEVAGNHSFLLQAIFDLKGSFARVEEKVDALKAQTKELDASVDALRHTVSVAKGVLIVAGVVFTLGLAIIGWMVGGDVKVSLGGDEAPILADSPAPPAPVPSVAPTPRRP